MGGGHRTSFKHLRCAHTKTLIDRADTRFGIQWIVHLTTTKKTIFPTWYFIYCSQSSVSDGCSLSCLLNSSVLPVSCDTDCPACTSCFSWSVCCCPFPCRQRAVEESYTPRGLTQDVVSLSSGKTSHMTLFKNNG